jgi:hypothetical protein
MFPHCNIHKYIWKSQSDWPNSGRQAKALECIWCSII